MTARLKSAWDEAHELLRLRSEEGAFENLIERMSEAHRRYHDCTHIDACVVLFEHYRSEAERPGEVLFALLFHDAVYDPMRSDNEELSAHLAKRVLGGAGASAESTERIASMISATAKHTASVERDTQLVLDIDLSILGESETVFEAFEANIRAEYAFVPDDLFRAGRQAVLAHFDSMVPIYRTRPLRERFEEQAHSNLRRAVLKLSSAPTCA